MDRNRSSERVAVKLGPTFGADVGRVRGGRFSWLCGISEAYDHVFTLRIPLELVGALHGSEAVPAEPSTSDPPAIEFALRGGTTTQGATPDQYTRDALVAGGGMETSVDSLSRSFLLTDVDEHTLLRALQEQTDLGQDHFAALKQELIVPTLCDDLYDSEQAAGILRRNVQRHETKHLECLLDPATAVWRELELYWRTVLTGANPRTWRDRGFLTQLAALYQTPSRFTLELLAMLEEDYSTDNSTDGARIKEAVTAQRGAEGVLLRFVEEHDLDQDALVDTLRSPVGERYCDLWLAYLIDELRAGCSLERIDEHEFHIMLNKRSCLHDEAAPGQDARRALVEFIHSQCFGPVFELVRLCTADEKFLLERSWFSMNPKASAAESLLAVRRALYRRQFLHHFGVETGLTSALAEREAAVERVIQDSHLDFEMLFSTRQLQTAHLAECLQAAQAAAATALLGPEATRDSLERWLNDPKFGPAEDDVT